MPSFKALSKTSSRVSRSSRSRNLRKNESFGARKTWIPRPTLAAALLLLSCLAAFIDRPVLAQTSGVPVAESVRRTLAIVASGSNGDVRLGTAFCVYSDSSSSYFLTNAHVVGGTAIVAVRLEQDQHIHRGYVLSRGAWPLDFAVVKVQKGSVPYLKLSAAPPAPGQSIAIMGYPGIQLTTDLHASVHAGIVNDVIKGYYIEHDALTDEGNSGGPLFDPRTALVYGVVTAFIPSETARAVQNNIAIMASRAKVFLQVALHGGAIANVGESLIRPRSTVPKGRRSPLSPPTGSAAAINSMLKANNFVGAAAEFDKMSSIPARDRSAAAATYATAAVQLQKTNAQQALTYAQKAVSLQADSNTYFALGVAQLANNQNADAAASLRRAHDVNGGPRTTKERAVLDSYLIQAYNATGDTADANTISAELKRISPNTASNASMPTLPDSFNQAVTAENAGKFDDAVSLYEQSAQTAPGIAVTAYSRAALAIGRMQPPDYRRMKAEADKALALNPNDPGANAAEGIAVTQLGIVNRDDGQKKQGLDILNNADAEAKAANITGLVNMIENFIKSVPQ